MEEMLEKLRNSGLTGNEAKVYFELLRKGSLSANELSKKISMDRTLSYTVINNLIEKGLVNYMIKDKKKYFEASDPSNLLNPLKTKEAYVKDLIPILKNVEKVKENTQEINVYEGKNAIKLLFTEFKKYKTVCSFGATGQAYDMLYESPHIAKEIEKMGITSRIITNSKYSNHPMTKISNIKMRYIDIKSEATTTIFKDKIVIHILTQKPLIIMIKNKEIAQTYQNHFEILWNCAEK